jgi:arylsulfatase A-like enzyme
MLRGNILQDAVGRRMLNGFHVQRASDLFIVAEPYWMFEEKGTSHGTPFVYDTHVPILFMGPGIKPGQYDQTVAVVDIAPTLALLLAIEPPGGTVGRVLTECLEPRKP